MPLLPYSKGLYVSTLGFPQPMFNKSMSTESYITNNLMSITITIIMKNLILLALFLFPLVTSAQVVEDVDEFTGVKTYRSEAPRQITIEEGDSKSAYYYAGFTESQWMVAIYSMSDTGTFNYNTETAYFLVDEERMRIPILDVSVDFKNQQMVSTAVINPTPEQFHQIGFADKVRLKVGQEVFGIPKEIRVDMRRIARLVSENN